MWDNPELAQMAKEDQGDRQNWERFSKADEQHMVTRDAERLKRIHQLLQADKIVTANDFDTAALICQHGRTPDDFLIAHELSIVHDLFGGNFGSMPALSEDRFLQSIGRRQRFGSQCTKEGKSIIKVSEGKITDVNDALRTDYLLPTLQEAKKNGIKAFRENMATIISRLEARLETKQQPPQELSQLASQLAEQPKIKNARSKVLEWYQEDQLITPAGYRDAAKVLLAVGQGDDWLLAHELATVAAIRRDNQARLVLAQSWDRFLVSVKLNQRFGTVLGAKRAESASDSVCKKILGAKE